MEGTTLGGRYLLAEEIGFGGMGVVHRALDLRTGGAVAVKLPNPLLAHDPTFRERLRREAQSAASLTSPRIVRVIDLDEHEGTPFLVMEYVPGDTLQDLLANRGALPLRDALNIGLEVARALEAAHSHGVIHRDLKPQNIKLVDGQIKVLDFGIARMEGLPGLTTASVFVGTPEYSAPEQIEGHSDARSDIYAFGVLLYVLLTGRLPFVGPTPMVVLDQQRFTPPPALPSHFPSEVAEVVNRCLAKAPEERFQTAGELVAAVSSASQVASGLVRTPTPPTQAIPPSSETGPPTGPAGYENRVQVSSLTDRTPPTLPVQTASQDARPGSTETDPHPEVDAQSKTPSPGASGLLPTARNLALAGVGWIAGGALAIHVTQATYATQEWDTAVLMGRVLGGAAAGGLTGLALHWGGPWWPLLAAGVVGALAGWLAAELSGWYVSQMLARVAGAVTGAYLVWMIFRTHVPARPIWQTALPLIGAAVGVAVFESLRESWAGLVDSAVDWSVQVELSVGLAMAITGLLAVRAAWGLRPSIPWIQSLGMAVIAPLGWLLGSRVGLLLGLTVWLVVLAGAGGWLLLERLGVGMVARSDQQHPPSAS